MLREGLGQGKSMAELAEFFERSLADLATRAKQLDASQRASSERRFRCERHSALYFLGWPAAVRDLPGTRCQGWVLASISSKSHR